MTQPLDDFLAELGLDAATLSRLEDEGIVLSGKLRESDDERDRLRVAAELLRLGVNLEGIDIILEMRRRMLSLQENSASLLRRLVDEMEERHSTVRSRRIEITIIET